MGYIKISNEWKSKFVSRMEREFPNSFDKKIGDKALEIMEELFQELDEVFKMIDICNNLVLEIDRSILVEGVKKGQRETAFKGIILDRIKESLELEDVVKDLLKNLRSLKRNI